jgi:hypothetical protein
VALTGCAIPLRSSFRRWHFSSAVNHLIHLTSHSKPKSLRSPRREPHNEALGVWMERRYWIWLSRLVCRGGGVFKALGEEDILGWLEEMNWASTHETPTGLFLSNYPSMAPFWSISLLHSPRLQLAREVVGGGCNKIRLLELVGRCVWSK